METASGPAFFSPVSGFSLFICRGARAFLLFTQKRQRRRGRGEDEGEGARGSERTKRGKKDEWRTRLKNKRNRTATKNILRALKIPFARMRPRYFSTSSCPADSALPPTLSISSSTFYICYFFTPLFSFSIRTFSDFPSDIKSRESKQLRAYLTQASHLLCHRCSSRRCMRMHFRPYACVRFLFYRFFFFNQWVPLRMIGYFCPRYLGMITGAEQDIGATVFYSLDSGVTWSASLCQSLFWSVCEVTNLCSLFWTLELTYTFTVHAFTHNWSGFKNFPSTRGRKIY